MDILFNTYNIIMQCLEKFLRTLENEIFSKIIIWRKISTFYDLNRGQISNAHFPIFTSISENESVIWSCFWCRCKELLLGNLLDTYSMTIQYLENFLIAFEKIVSLTKQTIVVICKPVSSKGSKGHDPNPWFSRI